MTDSSQQVTWDSDALFQSELGSIIQSRPPVSASKVSAITKIALSSLKFFKFVVHRVERALSKSPAEHRLSYLYVIDSICRHSRAKNGDRDPFVLRFSLNAEATASAVAQCSRTDVDGVRRVLDLWRKNSLFPGEVVAQFCDALDRRNPKIETKILPATADIKEETMEDDHAPSLPTLPPLPADPVAPSAPPAPLQYVPPPGFSSVEVPPPIFVTAAPPAVPQFAWQQPQPMQPPPQQQALPLSPPAVAVKKQEAAPKKPDAPDGPTSGFDYGDEDDDEARVRALEERMLQEERKLTGQDDPQEQPQQFPQRGQQEPPRPAAAEMYNPEFSNDAYQPVLQPQATGPTVHPSRQHLIGSYSSPPPPQRPQRGAARSGPTPPPNFKKIDSTTLFVGSIGSVEVAEQLEQVFGSFGPITKIRTMPDKGIAFITYLNRSDADLARLTMSSRPILGTVVKVSWGRGELPGEYFNKFTGEAWVPPDYIPPQTQPRQILIPSSFAPAQQQPQQQSQQAPVEFWGPHFSQLNPPGSEPQYQPAQYFQQQQQGQPPAPPQQPWQVQPTVESYKRPLEPEYAPPGTAPKRQQI